MRTALYLSPAGAQRVEVLEESDNRCLIRQGLASEAWVSNALLIAFRDEEES